MAGFFGMLKSHYKKNKERSQSFELFKACMAGAALTAMADGEFDRREDAAMKKLIRVVDELKLYGGSHTKALFMEFIEKIEEDGEAGRAEALEAVGAAKDNPEWGATVLMIAATLSEADGELDADEIQTINRLGDILGLDTANIQAMEVDFKDDIYH